jgi:hypothetical protein
VKTAEISDPAAESYMVQTLIERRDKCIRYWIARTNPLDRFAINGNGTEVTFDNAAVRDGAIEGEVTYDVEWSRLDNLANQETPAGEPVLLSAKTMKVPEDAWGPKDDAGYRYAVAKIRSRHSGNPQWAEPVVVAMRDKGGNFDIVGIERPRTDAAVKYSKERYPDTRSQPSP